MARTSSESLSSLEDPFGGRATLQLEYPHSGEQMEVRLPAAAVQVLVHALGEMAEGRSVALIPMESEVSTQQAAEMMGVSRPYFVKLLEQGRIPFRKIGDQRRVRYQDLIEYLEQYQQQATTALDEMAAEAQAARL